MIKPKKNLHKYVYRHVTFVTKLHQMTDDKITLASAATYLQNLKGLIR